MCACMDGGSEACAHVCPACVVRLRVYAHVCLCASVHVYVHLHMHESAYVYAGMRRRMPVSSRSLVHACLDAWRLHESMRALSNVCDSSWMNSAWACGSDCGLAFGDCGDAVAWVCGCVHVSALVQHCVRANLCHHIRRKIVSGAQTAIVASGTGFVGGPKPRAW